MSDNDVSEEQLNSLNEIISAPPDTAYAVVEIWQVSLKLYY